MKPPVLTLLALIITFLSNSKAQDAAADLTPTHRASFAAPFSPGSVVPTFDNGYVISRAVGGAPIVTLFDKNGAAGPRLILNFSDGSTIHQTSLAVSSKGEPIVAGWSASSSYFIAKGDPISGKLADPVVLGTFNPTQICEDADGNIWAFGYQPDSASQSYDRLRAYSSD